MHSKLCEYRQYLINNAPKLSVISIQVADAVECSRKTIVVLTPMLAYTMRIDKDTHERLRSNGNDFS